MKKFQLMFLIPLILTNLLGCRESEHTLEISLPNNITTIEAGELINFEVKLDNKVISPKEVTWDISNSKTAKIEANGLFRPLKSGQVEVEARLLSDLTVNANYSITISNENGGDYFIPKAYTMDDTNFRAHWGPTEQMLKSTGNQKVLVVPVKFSDGPEWTTSMLDQVNKAFFGTSSDTGWESVSSFYNKSSYGKLNITGELSDVLNLGITTSLANSTYGEDLPEKYVAPQFYAVANSQKLKEYDQDGDGYVDAVCFIYSNSYSNSSSSAYWAWVWNVDVLPNANKPQVSNYMWASYQFLNQGYGNGGIDAHTYIHEFGHILGLDDYYSNQRYQPMGGWVMMASNVLDHDVYSKMLKGWIDPYVIDNINEPVTLSLNPTASSGDFILIKNDWNGSAFDEYLLVEFYTPTNLNEKDALNGYTPNGFKNAFNIPGIKIYHVDSRGVEVDASYRFRSYIKESSQLGTSKYGIGASNYSASYSLLSAPYSSKYKLVHLLEATGTNSFSNGSNATNNTLFKQNDVFVASNVFFENGTKFNDGTAVGYQIKVDALSSSSATITVSKIS